MAPVSGACVMGISIKVTRTVSYLSDLSFRERCCLHHSDVLTTRLSRDVAYSLSLTSPLTSQY